MKVLYSPVNRVNESASLNRHCIIAIIIMKHIQVLCLIVFVAAIDCASIPSTDSDGDAECDEMLRMADGGMDKIMFFSDPAISQFKSPEDLKQKYCDPYPTYLKMLTNYTRCLKPFSRSLLKMSARNMRNIQKTICENPRKLEEAYSHVKCMDPSTKEEIAKVSYMGVSMAVFVSELEKVDDIIPAACCGQRVFVRKSMDRINQICSPRTGLNTGEFLSLMLNSMLGDVVDMICGKFPDDASCEKQIPRLFNETVTSIDDFQMRNHSYILPSVKMLKRLDEMTL